MSSISNDIIGITRTVYGTYLQTIERLKLPFVLIANTTLNEKFGVQAGVTPNAGVLPAMRYMAIGNYGHATVQASDGSDETIPVRHNPEDAGLFNQIPFVLRETGNDLTSVERAKYGLRVIETHGGVNYIAYYLRRLNMTGVVPQLQHIEVVDGVVITTPFVPTTANLNPTRPAIPNTGTVLGSNSYTASSAILNITLGPDDIAELLNAHEIRTGSTRSPVISEIALVSGVDRDITVNTGGGGSFVFTEVICAQINTHIATYHPVGYATDGLVITLDVGGVEPTLAGN